MSSRMKKAGMMAALGVSFGFASLGFSTPAMAQSTMDIRTVPTCSATITDHCINREARMARSHVVKHRKHAKRQVTHHRKAHRKGHAVHTKRKVD